MVARSEKLSPTRPSLRSEMEDVAVEGDDAGRLLAAMLEGVEAERRDRRRVRMAVDAEDAAFLAQRVAVEVEVHLPWAGPATSLTDADIIVSLGCAPQPTAQSPM